MSENENPAAAGGEAASPAPAGAAEPAAPLPPDAAPPAAPEPPPAEPHPAAAVLDEIQRNLNVQMNVRWLRAKLDQVRSLL